MKKIMITLICGLLLGVLMTGCTKDPTTEPVNPPATLTFDVKQSSDTIQKGGVVTYTITSNADSCSVFLSSGEKYKITTNGTKSFTLNQSTTFNFTFYKSNLTPGTKSCTTFVKDATPEMPTVHITVVPVRTSYPYGSNIAINITATNYKSVTSTDIPGVNGPGSYTISNLLQTKTFHAKASNEVGSAVDSVTVVVDPKILPTKTDFLVLASWSDDTVWYKQQENDPWDFIFEPTLEWTIYCRDGTVKLFQPPNTVISDWFWSWSENEEDLMYGTYQNIVIKLDSTTMILKRLEACSYCPSGYMIVMRKYIHKYK